jgi:hypothetical protein
MNTPTRAGLDQILSTLGNSTGGLGDGSIGLIAAAFSPGPNLTFAGITEASFHGYARKALNSSSVTFTGGDGNEYVELGTFQWLPSDTVTPNNIYGAFLTYGNSSTNLWGADPFAAPLPMSSPANQITITVRVGLNPAGNFGLNIISN